MQVEEICFWQRNKRKADEFSYSRIITNSPIVAQSTKMQLSDTNNDYCSISVGFSGHAYQRERRASNRLPYARYVYMCGGKEYELSRVGRFPMQISLGKQHAEINTTSEYSGKKRYGKMAKMGAKRLMLVKKSQFLFLVFHVLAI